MQRAYCLLLHVYPEVHRRQYGPLMAQLFRDMCADAYRQGGTLGLIGLWGRTLVDTVRTAVPEHLYARGVLTMAELPAKIGHYAVKRRIESWVPAF